MPTPAIQTLINDAQQVLNLDSISAVRSVVAVSLANANTGTPLNPNLTTQQLWNEFYQVVPRSKSDIESIIANQLMKFLYSPPAPGGVGADKQVIFNDNGILAGDAGLTYDKATDSLTVLGSLGVGTSPTQKFVCAGPRSYFAGGGALYGIGIGFNTTRTAADHVFFLGATDSATPDLVFSGASGAALMRIDAAGNLGIGVTPSAGGSIYYKTLEIGKAGCGLFAATTPLTSSEFTYLSGNGVLAYNAGPEWKYGNNGAAAIYGIEDGVHKWYNATSGTAGVVFIPTQAMTLDLSSNLLLTGNVVPANGKGIDFSATADGPSLTSELLNDYEEGTFLPAIIGTTTAGAGTYANQIGRYTKIGRIVTAQIFVNWSAHTGTGDMRLSGLPFVSNPTAGVFAGAAIGWVNNITLNAGYILTGYVLENSVQINLQQTPTGGGGTLTVPIDTSGGIILTVTYSV